MIGFEPISRFPQNNNFKEKLLSVFLKTKYEKINAFYQIKLHPDAIILVPYELIGYLLCVEMDSNHHSTIFSLCPTTCGLEPRTTCPCASTFAPSTHILKNTHYISLSRLRPKFRPALTSLACQLVLAGVSFCVLSNQICLRRVRGSNSRATFAT